MVERGDLPGRQCPAIDTGVVKQSGEILDQRPAVIQHSKIGRVDVQRASVSRGGPGQHSIDVEGV